MRRCRTCAPRCAQWRGTARRTLGSAPARCGTRSGTRCTTAPPDLAGADLDLAYLDHGAVDPARDAAHAAALAAALPGLRWSVTNQARMHARNGHARYPDLATAVARWPETATAVVTRLVDGRLELLAPHGLADLRHLRLRPTPAYAARPEVVEARAAARRWRARWPRLTVIQPLGA